MAAPRVPNWQAQILKGVGAPVTPQNVLFVNDWARAEGGSAENNPFNTTQPGFGAIGNYNSVGVKRYATPQQGIAATIATLRNGRYGNILNALHQGTNARADAEALAASPWGTGALVLKMLGGTGTAGRGAAPAAGPGGAIPPPAVPSRVAASPFVQQLLAQTSQILGVQPIALPGALQSSPAAPSGVGVRPQPPAPSGPMSPLKTTGANVGHLDPTFKTDLERAVAARGAVGIYYTSGERDPGHNAAVGGASHSNHLPDQNGNAHAVDGYAILRDGSRVPLGEFLKPVAPRFGLRSGATFTWGGKPDVVHVDDFHNGGH